ncbi:Epidermal patterning factor-like protein 6 [Vitis vinifera]|uniref:Epidermal patterning factor-like protein n=1 Tax=Vitis vinifera TaxID=29760 RepID=A0A438KNN8_VITVI|nr:Epidermal patterning factor-like protein 6 [Vitis vinifera]
MELKNSTALRFMHRPRLIYLTISIFFLSICALLTSISSTRTACLDIKCSLNADGDLYFQANLGYNEPMGQLKRLLSVFKQLIRLKCAKNGRRRLRWGWRHQPPLGNWSLPTMAHGGAHNPWRTLAPPPSSSSHGVSRTLIDKTLNNSEQKRTIQTNRGVPFSLARRYLSGPGSSPPRCTSKCGKCTPCKPVHVAVPPGTPVTTEYYPEAWRCKCGNKLYMP